MENSIGLSSDTINKIISVFAKYTKIEKVILYGSRAIGSFRESSDIDLTIVGPTLSTADMLTIELELDDLLLPYKIDLSLFQQIENKELLNHIEKVGIKFFP